MGTRTISARVDAAEAALIEMMAEEQGCDRSGFIKTVLRRGIRELRMERAVAEFADERITLSRAAEVAGVSVWDFLARMPRERLDLHYDVKEFEEDLVAFEKKKDQR